MPDLDALGAELKDFTSKAHNTLETQNARLMAIEQMMTAPRGGGLMGETKSIGQTVVESQEFKSFSTGNYARTGRIPVPNFHSKTTIVNAAGLNQPLVPAFRRPGVVAPGQQRLTIRDLLPQLPIASNMVEYCKEASFTSAAAMQTSEGAAKAESELTFSLSYSPVQTLAHWIPASRQVMEDSAALAGYINQRLMYLLKLKEEDELLNGSGLRHQPFRLSHECHGIRHVLHGHRDRHVH